ncbi:MAG: 4-hydroxy-3-methylbut-2-enyl diphosphate reductase [Coriobacteriia bacterium]|nr:4-hydroxy-3-methylbut-2-enyl diphosphate reductase [Coriobacteriia bacterium]MCL2749619.1 4-hydroxy-3-methylbut-2-enyl diphosphate reductase [Coriobacteriia bacterium]
MKVELADYAGACYGVERALSLTNQAALDFSKVHTLGPLIHNPQVVSELALRGICEVESVEQVEEGVLVIRSHGVAPQVIDEARENKLVVVDATCPYVKKAQKAATELRRQGYSVVIVGEKGHPEVEGIDAYAGSESLVVQDPADLPEVLPEGPVGIVVQTTQNVAHLDDIVQALKQRGVNPLVRNTICFATTQRQESAALLAHKVDAMVVVGGRNSGNTTRLAEICELACANTHHIERPKELDPRWFEGVQTVGVTAGASTPQEQITAVVTALQQL